MLIFEDPDFDKILDAWLPILYAGALSGGVGYTLQTVAQKWTKPSVASLLMSLESVFAVLAGALILHQIPTLRENFGCVLMFISIVLVQISENHLAGDEKYEK
jgi:drug/metabolite transporter (DMT)-like permease